MLYKYLSPERVDVLTNLKIRFSQTSALNDPFEGAPIIEIPEGRETMRAMLQNESKDFWIQHPEHMNDEKFTAEFEESLNGLHEHITQITDPYRIGSELSKAINLKIGILSLSRTYRSLLMWSHYAESHKGFVIGFDDEHEFFHGVNTTGKPVPPSSVRYSSERSHIQTTDYDYYHKILCEKPIEWSYEEEVRVFLQLPEIELNQAENLTRDNNKEPLCLVDLPIEVIKSIYIGANANLELKDKILEALSSHSIEAQVFDAQLSKSSYEIQPAPISLGH